MTTWVKLHDNFFRNPKVLAAGEDAALLYLQGLTYCSDSLTDGAIPTAALRMLTAKKEARTLARILVREGLWTETATGWTVHDYLEHQRSRGQIEAEREAARTRKARSRSRSSHAVTPPVTDGVSHGDVTQPETDTETESDPPPPPSVPSEVWWAYMKTKAEGKTIGDRQAWAATVIASAKSDPELVRDAEWIWSTYEIEPCLLGQMLATGERRHLNTIRKRETA